MKKISTLVIMIGILSLLMAISGWAQTGMGRGSGGGMHYGMMWDAGAVTTVSGEVVAVEQYTPGRGGSSYGLRLTLKTDQETLPVILGPARYVEQQHFTFNAKDQLEVKGSRLSIQGQPTLIAAEVKKGNQLLKLRDNKGIPLWAGPR